MPTETAAELTGMSFIAGRRETGGGAAFRGEDPVRNAALEPEFRESTEAQVAACCAAAAACFDDFRSRAREERAALLEGIAAEIVALGEGLLERASQETGLPLARLTGERARTVGQLRMFAEVLREGAYLGEVHDTALPDRQPLPRPELLLQKIAVGPVAVFGASNFPLAFSVAGGDTASALAAGCPVVAKAHPSHPGTSEMVAGAVEAAVKKSGMPAGIFSMVHGAGHAVGSALVRHPGICAVAFTGSRRGGLALVQAAQSRAVPVPVFAEMSSVNPVFVLPGALEARGAAIATGYVDSLTMGTGQFCTQPGLLFVARSEAVEGFVESAAQALRAKTATPLLNRGIHDAYTGAVAQLRDAGAVELVAEGVAPEGTALCGRPALFRTTFAQFRKETRLQDEIFGPSSLVIVCDGVDEMRAAAELLEGQLTATLQVEPADYEAARGLVPVLERKAGRVLVNGFPTGVEVGRAMVHGGPFPATSDSRFTSVGAEAIERFLRPVCYQSFPAELLPRR